MNLQTLNGRVQSLCAGLTTLLEVLGRYSCQIRKAFVLHTLVKLQVSPFIQLEAAEMTLQVRGIRESERTRVQTLRTHVEPGIDLVACICNPVLLGARWKWRQETPRADHPTCRARQ